MLRDFIRIKIAIIIITGSDRGINRKIKGTRILWCWWAINWFRAKMAGSLMKSHSTVSNTKNVLPLKLDWEETTRIETVFFLAISEQEQNILMPVTCCGSSMI